MHPIEFTWYKAIVLLVSAIAIGFGIVNIFYFNKIRLNNNCNDISQTEANTGLWLNIVLVVFAAILFFWSLFRLIFSGKPEEKKITKTYNTHIHEAPSMLNGSTAIGTPVSSPAPVVATSSSLSANYIAPGTEASISRIQQFQ